MKSTGDRQQDEQPDHLVVCDVSWIPCRRSKLALPILHGPGHEIRGSAPMLPWYPPFKVKEGFSGRWARSAQLQLQSHLHLYRRRREMTVMNFISTFVDCHFISLSFLRQLVMVWTSYRWILIEVIELLCNDVDQPDARIAF